MGGNDVIDGLSRDGCPSSSPSTSWPAALAAGSNLNKTPLPSPSLSTLFAHRNPHNSQSPLASTLTDTTVPEHTSDTQRYTIRHGKHPRCLAERIHAHHRTHLHARLPLNAQVLHQHCERQRPRGVSSHPLLVYARLPMLAQLLELEKQRNLSKQQHKTSTPISGAPGWNEALATSSEAAVKVCSLTTLPALSPPAAR